MKRDIEKLRREATLYRDDHQKGCVCRGCWMARELLAALDVVESVEIDIRDDADGTNSIMAYDRWLSGEEPSR